MSEDEPEGSSVIVREETSSKGEKMKLLRKDAL